MLARKIKEHIYWMGSVDWDSRLFDALIPLPDGTSYNAYLIRGSEKTVLLDTVDPPMANELLAQLKDNTILSNIGPDLLRICKGFYYRRGTAF